MLFWSNPDDTFMCARTSNPGDFMDNRYNVVRNGGGGERGGRGERGGGGGGEGEGRGTY